MGNSTKEIKCSNKKLEIKENLDLYKWKEKICGEKKIESGRKLNPINSKEKK